MRIMTTNITPGPWERYGFIGQSGLMRVRACTGTDRVGRKQYVDVPATAGDSILIASAPELAEALRELHDFAVVDSHYRYEDRSKAAFSRAAELLKRVEG